MRLSAQIRHPAYWEAGLTKSFDVLAGLHNTISLRCSRYYAGYGLQPIRCAASDWWLPCRCGCHTMRASFGALEESLRSKLTSISAASIDRLLKPIRVQHPKGLSGTKPGTLLKNQIPIRTTHWDITLPGFMEADTVAHCGNSLAGDFVWSLTLTDILTGWTECRATWNKGSSGVLEQIKAIEQALPFKLRGFDCDNGSEFLNHHLLRYFSEHPVKPVFTRSRPYKKNDNAHVEQKNWTHVRQLFGYERLTTQLGGTHEHIVCQ